MAAPTEQMAFFAVFASKPRSSSPVIWKRTGGAEEWGFIRKENQHTSSAAIALNVLTQEYETATFSGCILFKGIYSSDVLLRFR